MSDSVNNLDENLEVIPIQPIETEVSPGDDTVPTPNLDRLAAQSVRFANAFATLKQTDPELAASVDPYLSHLLDWDCRSTEECTRTGVDQRAA